MQEHIFGVDLFYMNKDYLDIIHELQQAVKNKKHNKAGTDVVILDSKPDTVYLIDHSSQKELEVHKKEGRHGVGIRKVFKTKELTEDDIKEIVRNIGPSYEYSEARVRHVLQTLGLEERHLSEFDLAAELKRVADINDAIYGKKGCRAHTGGYGQGRYYNNVRQGGNRTKGGLGQTQYSIDWAVVPPLPVGNTLYRDLGKAKEAHAENVKELNKIGKSLHEGIYESSMQTGSGEIKISQFKADKDEDRIYISSGRSIFDRVSMSIVANANKNLIGGSVIFPDVQILEEDKNYNRLDNPIRDNHFGILKAVLSHFIAAGHERPASTWRLHSIKHGYKSRIDTLSKILGIDVSPYFQYELSEPIDSVGPNGEHMHLFKERVIVDARGLLNAIPSIQDISRYAEVKNAIEFQ